MITQDTVMESKSGRVLQYAKRAALSGPGKLMLAVGAIGSLMSITLPTGAGDRNEHEGNEHYGNERDGEESKIQQDFAVAPVPLQLHGKNRAPVGLGSYNIVNAQGGCNDCHATPSYAPGHDPLLGQHLQVNAATYQGGGRAFGPVITARNITPDEHERPAGLTRDHFITAMRPGIDEDGGILQVMPWPAYGEMTDRDLKAIYEHLSSIQSLSGPGPRWPMRIDHFWV